MKTYKKQDFPERDCPWGYTWSLIEAAMDEATFREFKSWMSGQTMTICEGRSYNHELRMYEPDCCVDHPHGPVVYEFDVHRFLGFLGEKAKELWD